MVSLSRLLAGRLGSEPRSVISQMFALRVHKTFTSAHRKFTPLPAHRSRAYSSGKPSWCACWGIAALIDYRLLGPTEVGLNGHPVDIGGQKQRALLTILVLSANVAVSRDVLVDRLWGEHPPAGAQHTLAVYVSRLRKTLEPAAGGPVVLARPGAYVLRAAEEHIDIRRFERLAAQGRRALEDGAPDRAAADLREALALWRGAPLSDVSQERFAQGEIARLDEMRAGVIEDRIDADLALGRHGDLVGELQALVGAHPLRERLYQQLMIALYRCGRQAEALAVYQSARRTLVQELGIEPSPGLRRVERAILEHDVSLEPPARAVQPQATAPAEGRRPAVGGRCPAHPIADRCRGEPGSPSGAARDHPLERLTSRRSLRPVRTPLA